jgi:hypothetical protein
MNKIGSFQIVVFMIVEGFIFLVLWIFTQFVDIPYEYVLLIAGILITTLPFISDLYTPSGYGIYNDQAARNELNQMQERFNARSNRSLLNWYAIYGIPILLAGIAIAVL